MADEIDAGAAYLAALKRSAVPQATGAAPGRAAAPASPPEAPPTPALSTGRTGPVSEKRRSPRYRCQGSTQLREINSGASMWATFSDISLHGCYVEAAAGYPFGSIVALTIEINGFRVEAMGEVRAAYPGLGMGISFIQLSENDQERLRTMVRSLSEPAVIMGTKAVVNPQPRPEPAPPVLNHALALEALSKFFENRHVMGRDEFLRILRKSKV